ncbi:MAG: hypothetical protein EOO17_00745 [Chloroflexi bacterium]|nr:MAG: hypothetical protein EOO17_00745 [Chloroflexota bacterium]
MLRTKTTRGSVGSIISAVFTVGLLIASVWLWVNRQYVVDQIAVWQYQPTAEIQQFADRTTMTDGGRFYLYASSPSLEKSQDFNQKCDRKEASAAVLGCYASGKIYIYDVSDEQLDGIREVTTAHETLHAIYQRMSTDEKARINALLEAEYAKLQGNAELVERMAFYQRTQPGEQNNELHSILGTEFPNLGSELEQHYSKYFANREAIVDLHTKYAEVFNSLKAQSEMLADQLKTLASEIQADSATYNRTVSQLNDDIESFNSRASSGSMTRAQFDSQRQALSSRLSRLDTQRNTIDSSIQSYEKLRQQYNELADTSQKLYDSIDSSLAPAPSI